MKRLITIVVMTITLLFSVNVFAADMTEGELLRQESKGSQYSMTEGELLRQEAKHQPVYEYHEDITEGEELRQEGKR